MGLLEGKVAIVTGGAGAIGRAVSLGLAAEGAAVLVNDIGATLDGTGRDLGPAKRVAEEIIAGGGRAAVSTLSASDLGNAEKIVAQALGELGGLHSVIHIAGILRDNIFHKMTWEDWTSVLDVHLNGGYAIARAAAPHFRQQNGGAYVFATSTSALIGNFGQANYMAAKMALIGLARGIALDMRRFNVRSNCIAPLAWSRMISSLPTQTEAEKLRVERLQRMSPDKVAPLVAYLVSDAAAEISGQIFGVRNNEIYLFNQPRPIRTLHTAQGWAPASLTEMMPALRSAFTPLEQSSEVFTWDPV
ncbi:3-hydroxyacyl-CoA dehydrogenase [Methylovirgula ligni]|uniref:NAD(P)-dependent dehydrogenase (Short-subunit alcohol dehydrogenase family) n=1 Tax=Methylovirgula ligni TaxID=569860 RepID=A0A3D9Z6L8_9HYPH|nr:SDR family oxidoreductase [Methylovirgula ligni]QAY95488.1 3-hydroxyacyl-CoA dehydrogenase [Methylovirgula ligni]REF89179.1 NAD(P)-dependent dehydrogenase (short-subunit alcohol dehydrogenase family) [Methylovirgula ligni]